MQTDASGLAPEAPIGIFDSGLGGLTVAEAVRRRMPSEALIYLGDTARIPYGTRSPQTVLSYARSCARLLAGHGIKLLVVACNTVSAVALDMLAVELDVPVLGVIGPGARAGVARSRSKRVGVIATAGTVYSGAYERQIQGFDSRVESLVRSAPLLVPLVEEGWLEGEVPRLAVRRYLEPLVSRGIDTLVLGCTHYPLLRAVIEAELALLSAEPVAVVDSAEATAVELEAELGARQMAAPAGRAGSLRLLVTDRPRHFADVAARFLGEQVAELDVEQVDL
ncbi:MAG: glutamate racemase [Myxococcales bacterium]|nr:glutamate racemase [Myxococcales bacterium]